jgi:hypothetical protein
LQTAHRTNNALAARPRNNPIFKTLGTRDLQMLDEAHSRKLVDIVKGAHSQGAG